MGLHDSSIVIGLAYIKHCTEVVVHRSSWYFNLVWLVISSLNINSGIGLRAGVPINSGLCRNILEVCMIESGVWFFPTLGGQSVAMEIA